MRRTTPPQAAAPSSAHASSSGHLQPASSAEAASYRKAEKDARRVEAEALGTGLDDTGQPPETTLPVDGAGLNTGARGGSDAAAANAASVQMGNYAASTAASRAAKAQNTHPSVVEVKQARALRRQTQMRDHGNGPQYNPHRDDRGPAAHQADSGNGWHQAS